MLSFACSVISLSIIGRLTAVSAIKYAVVVYPEEATCQDAKNREGIQQWMDEALGSGQVDALLGPEGKEPSRLGAGDQQQQKQRELSCSEEYCEKHPAICAIQGCSGWRRSLQQRELSCSEEYCEKHPAICAIQGCSGWRRSLKERELSCSEEYCEKHPAICAIQGCSGWRRSLQERELSCSEEYCEKHPAICAIQGCSGWRRSLKERELSCSEEYCEKHPAICTIQGCSGWRRSLKERELSCSEEYCEKHPAICAIQGCSGWRRFLVSGTDDDDENNGTDYTIVELLEMGDIDVVTSVASFVINLSEGFDDKNGGAIPPYVAIEADDTICDPSLLTLLVF